MVLDFRLNFKAAFPVVFENCLGVYRSASRDFKNKAVSRDRLKSLRLVDDLVKRDDLQFESSTFQLPDIADMVSMRHVVSLLSISRIYTSANVSFSAAKF